MLDIHGAVLRHCILGIGQADQHVWNTDCGMEKDRGDLPRRFGVFAVNRMASKGIAGRQTIYL